MGPSPPSPLCKVSGPETSFINAEDQIPTSSSMTPFQ